MSLLSDIENYTKQSKLHKWQILKGYEDEINLMLEKNIPIKKQVELIKKNKILARLEYMEYTNILKKHFGYIPKKQLNKSPKPHQNIEKKKARKSATELLSQDVNLMDYN